MRAAHCSPTTEYPIPSSWRDSSLSSCIQYALSLVPPPALRSIMRCPRGTPPLMLCKLLAALKVPPVGGAAHLAAIVETEPLTLRGSGGCLRSSSSPSLSSSITGRGVRCYRVLFVRRTTEYSVGSYNVLPRLGGGGEHGGSLPRLVLGSTRAAPRVRGASARRGRQAACGCQHGPGRMGGDDARHRPSCNRNS